MILRMPSYCSDFKCTADKCSDNCCIGWEIDIDSETHDYYRSVGGEFGKRLKTSIEGESPACFVLGEHERCPFLNNQNLCDIYINLGEEHLCQICSDHPRYFEWFNGIKEGGTGLGCEESARLILTQNIPFSYTETEIPFEDCEDYDTALYEFMFLARNEIITHLQDRSLGIKQRISDVIFYAEELQFKADNRNFDFFKIRSSPEILELHIPKLLELFSELEPLDSERPEYLKRCITLNDPVQDNYNSFLNGVNGFERYLENLAVYFIWRHFMKGVFTGEFYSSVFFMSVSVNIISYLSQCFFYENGNISENDIIRIAKEYSKETEYSDLNLSRVLDAAYGENSFFL